ncbi:hypothetical protein EAF00_007112 [Botryotinia globosa]|nr:hypothetical protein EAF00_007112 [Botryotinia globosa]
MDRIVKVEGVLEEQKHEVQWLSTEQRDSEVLKPKRPDIEKLEKQLARSESLIEEHTTPLAMLVEKQREMSHTIKQFEKCRLQQRERGPEAPNEQTALDRIAKPDRQLCVKQTNRLNDFQISGIRYDATKEVSEIIKKQSFPRVDVDWIERMENSIEELDKKSEDSFPAKTSEAIIDRFVVYTAENHNTLEEMVREVDKRHSSQRDSFMKALETKIYCTSQAAIDRVADLERSLKEFQTKLAGMARLAMEPQLQRCKQYAELFEKQAVEFRPDIDRIVRLEDNISDFRPFKDKLDSLETCTQGFQKWLDEMACGSAEYRLQQDNLRTEFLKRQALESQTFVERIVNFEKNTTDMTRLMEENKVSGETMRKFMLNFRFTSDQIAQLRKEVQSYDSQLGAVSVALNYRRLQRLKEHTELIEERMSHIQTDFDNMFTRFAAEAQNIAIQAVRFEVTRENISRDRQIDDLAQSIRPIMLRLAGLESTEKQSDKMVMMRLGALEKNEKQSDDMMMLRLAALEEKNERQVSRILKLERGNQSLQREVMKLQQPNVE